MASETWNENRILMCIHFARWLSRKWIQWMEPAHDPVQYVCAVKVKSKAIPRQAEVALGVPGEIRPRIFSTFGTTRVVGRQANVLAAFTPGEIPGTHFQRLSRPQGTWLCRKEPRKKSQVTPPEIDPRTVRLVAQRHMHNCTVPLMVYNIYDITATKTIFNDFITIYGSK
jgi:hypothetical protein